MKIIEDIKVYRGHQIAGGKDSFSAMMQFRDFFRWRNSLGIDSDTIAAGNPWVTFGSIDELSRRVRPNQSVFEYGSGGSTVFFSRRAGFVHSVEHDPAWFARVDTFMRREKLNWSGLLRPPSACLDFEISGGNYFSTDEKFKGLSFENYVNTILNFDDNYFDIVLLDGRARVGCYIAAFSKVKPGGLIVLDNAERAEYQFIEQDALSRGCELKEFFGPGPYNSYFWRTIHITKPIR